MQLALRDRLAYPAGMAPGFDPTHVASVGAAASVYAMPGDISTSTAGLFDIIAGKSIYGGNGTQDYFIEGALGPVNIVGGYGAQYYGSPTSKPTNLSKKITAAAMFRVPPNWFNGGVIFFCDSASSSSIGVAPGINGSRAMRLIKNFGGSQTDVVSTVILEIGTPYFLAYSSDDAVGVTFVARNLLTGVVQSQFVANTVAVTSTPAGDYGYPNPGAGLGDRMWLAAAMFNNVRALPLAYLLAWAEDPWAFWYPRVEPETFVGSSLANQFLQTVSVACAATVSLTKSIAKAAAVACSSTASSLKQVTKPIAVSASSAVTSGAIRVFLRTVSVVCLGAVSLDRKSVV